MFWVLEQKFQNFLIFFIPLWEKNLEKNVSPSFVFILRNKLATSFTHTVSSYKLQFRRNVKRATTYACFLSWGSLLSSMGAYADTHAYALLDHGNLLWTSLDQQVHFQKQNTKGSVRKFSFSVRKLHIFTVTRKEARAIKD